MIAFRKLLTRQKRIKIRQIFFFIIFQINWNFRIRVRSVLLQQAFQHVRIPSKCAIFRVHLAGLLYILLDAWDSQFLCLAILRQIHLQISQDGLSKRDCYHIFFFVVLIMYIFTVIEIEYRGINFRDLLKSTLGLCIAIIDLIMRMNSGMVAK